MCEKEADERRELYHVCPGFDKYMGTIQKTTGVTAHHRRAVFEWNLAVADDALELSNEALHYAFAYFDQYLSRVACPLSCVKQVSTAAMWIASKICSTDCYVATAEKLEEIVGIDREKIKQMELWLVSRRVAASRTHV